VGGGIGVEESGQSHISVRSRLARGPPGR
jgi:hypothetical protein